MGTLENMKGRNHIEDPAIDGEFYLLEYNTI
jgi:hypothetical protein